ncbi:MAG: hypothetical protein K6A35_09695 [bacterium]|nr:hypothetical protein [bacterium]
MHSLPPRPVFKDGHFKLDGAGMGMVVSIGYFKRKISGESLGHFQVAQ